MLSRGKSLANPHDCEGIHGRPGIRCLLTWPASDCQGMREGATGVCEEKAFLGDGFPISGRGRQMCTGYRHLCLGFPVGVRAHGLRDDSMPEAR